MVLITHFSFFYVIGPFSQVLSHIMWSVITILGFIFCSLWLHLKLTMLRQFYSHHHRLGILHWQCFVSSTLIKGALAYRVSSFPKKFEFASLCSFICLQAVYQLSGPVCKATWNGCPSYSASYLHFTLCD